MKNFKKEPNIIDNWLEENGNQEIAKQVEIEAEELSKQEIIEEVAEKLKSKELFNESNDRARKILSEIKSLPTLDYTALLQPVGTKQETLEEIVNKLSIKEAKDLDLFLKGIEWQKEKDKNKYSEVFEWLANKDYLSDEVDIIQKEFEQFKNK